MKVVVLSDAGFASAVDRAGSPVPSSHPSVQAQNDAPHVKAAIEEAGHDVVAVVATEANDLDRVVDEDADLVVNLCDSFLGDPQLAALVPAFLDAHGILHTGGDAFSVALCKRKQHVKHALVARGLPTPLYQCIEPADDVDAFVLRLAAPVILKLVGEHASVGIDGDSVCFDVAGVQAKARALLQKHRQAVLVEEYVGGREFFVSCIGRPLRALPLMEHTFTGFPVRTFDKKWRALDAVDVDARFSLPVPHRAPVVAYDGGIDDIHDVAVTALDAVGARDWGRVDFRIDKGGVPLIIDVTPMTYVHPDAPCLLAAAAAGLSCVEFWRVVVDGAARG